MTFRKGFQKRAKQRLFSYFLSSKVYQFFSFSQTFFLGAIPNAANTKVQMTKRFFMVNCRVLQCAYYFMRAILLNQTNGGSNSFADFFGREIIWPDLRV